MACLQRFQKKQPPFPLLLDSLNLNYCQGESKAVVDIGPFGMAEVVSVLLVPRQRRAVNYSQVVFDYAVGEGQLQQMQISVLSGFPFSTQAATLLYSSRLTDEQYSRTPHHQGVILASRHEHQPRAVASSSEVCWPWLSRVRDIFESKL